jgi:cupin fold WbuC family metalloprotein
MNELPGFHQDRAARSLSFYSNASSVKVDSDLISRLVLLSEANQYCNARICLHGSPDSNFHEMLILERSGYYYPPHKHAGKAQSVGILRGAAAVFVFDDEGNISSTCVLGKNDNLIFRIGEDRYHLTLPLTDYVVYHEGKPGPFLRQGDSIYAEWAPGKEDKQAVAAYVDWLRSKI